MSTHARNHPRQFPPGSGGRSARSAARGAKPRAARRQAEREHGALYERQEGGLCIYCGAPANGGGDHVPPLSQAHKGHKFALRLWPCCARCNTAIAAATVTCLSARATRAGHAFMARLEADAVARVSVAVGRKVPAGLLSDPEREALVRRVRGISERAEGGNLRDVCPCRFCSGGGPFPEDVGDDVGQPGRWPPLPDEPSGDWVPNDE